MSSLSKLTIILFYLFISWSLGVLVGQSTPIEKPVYHQVIKQVPVYLPVHNKRHFKQQTDLLAAAIPVSLLKKGH